MTKIRIGDGRAEQPPLSPALERGIFQELGAVGELTSARRAAQHRERQDDDG